MVVEMDNMVDAASSESLSASVATSATFSSATPGKTHRVLLALPSSPPNAPSSMPSQSPPPGARCYIASLYNAEVDLASAVSSRAVLASTTCTSVNTPSYSLGKGQPNQPNSASSKPLEGSAGKGVSKGGPALLTDMQRWAVELASSAPIMLLTGEDLCEE